MSVDFDFSLLTDFEVPREQSQLPAYASQDPRNPFPDHSSPPIDDLDAQEAAEEDEEPSQAPAYSLNDRNAARPPRPLVIARPRAADLLSPDPELQNVSPDRPPAPAYEQIEEERQREAPAAAAAAAPIVFAQARRVFAIRGAPASFPRGAAAPQRDEPRTSAPELPAVPPRRVPRLFWDLPADQAPETPDELLDVVQRNLQQPTPDASSTGKRSRTAEEDEDDDQQGNKRERSGGKPRTQLRRTIWDLSAEPPERVVDGVRQANIARFYKTCNTVTIASSPPIEEEDDDSTGDNVTPVVRFKSSPPSTNNPFLGTLSSSAAERHRHRFHPPGHSPGHTPFTREEFGEHDTDEMVFAEGSQPQQQQDVNNQDQLEDESGQLPNREMEETASDSEDLQQQIANPYRDLTFAQWMQAGNAFADRLGQALTRFAEIQRVKRVGQQTILDQIEAHQLGLDTQAERLDKLRDKLSQAHAL